MPTKYKVKFREDGERCPKNEKQLKNLPECGIIYDRDNIPFVPDNPLPHHPKFEPINRGFPIGDLTHPIHKPLKPKIPHKPSRARKIAEVVGAGIDDLDTTNPFYIGAGIKKYGIYERDFLARDAENITAPNDYFNRFNVNFSEDTPYEGQEDPLQMSRTFNETTRALDEALELADLPAFARDAPVTERILPLARQMTVAEAKRLGVNALKDPNVQKAVIEKQLEKLVRPTRPQITRNEMETIKRNLKDVIDPEIVERYIIDNDYIDLEFEQDISEISNTKQRQLMRRVRSMRRGFVRERTQPVSNFNPLDVEFGDELEPYTPLADRTDIRPARSRLQKELQKRAGKLPEPARQVFKQGERFAENLRLKSIEAREQAQIKISKFFRSKYESVPLGEEGFEFQDLGRTGEGISTEMPRGLQEEIVDIPLEEFEAVRIQRPPLPKLRLGTTEEIRSAGVGTAGVVTGLLTGLGVAKGLEGTIDNPYAVGAIAGGFADTSAKVAMRGLQRAGLSAGEEALTGVGLAKGFTKGAVLAPIAIGADMLLSSQLNKVIHSHAATGAISGGVVAGLITALAAAGEGTAVASTAAAPETAGTSLVGYIPAALLIGTSSLLGFLTGQSQDKQEKQQKELNARYTNVNMDRRQIIKILPRVNYDIDRAIKEYGGTLDLGVGLDDYDNWYEGVKSSFSNNPVTPTNDTKNNDEKLNTYYSKYILHQMIENLCAGGKSCSQLRKQDPGLLTADEYKYLKEKAGDNWQDFADTSIQLSLEQNRYKHDKMQSAQDTIIQAWKIDKKVLNQIDPKVVELAMQDPTFKERFEEYIKADALNIVVDSYYDNQTKIEQLPKNVRDTANLNKDFNVIIHRMYNTIEQQADQLDITIPQVIKLQGVPADQQKKEYSKIVFDNSKEDPAVLAQAKKIVEMEDLVREEDFYDLDQALLTTDPTAITTWRPNDSQILQAHSAGMTLNQYSEYMHELSKGTVGDYNNLPEYSQEEIRSFGLLDWSHFKDELSLAGYDQNLYRYDPDSLAITLNGEISDIPNANRRELITKFTPLSIILAREEYADKVHGLNQELQADIDLYNQNLRDEIAGSGATDIDKLYEENKLSIEDILKPVSTETNVSLLPKTGKTLEGLEPVSLAPAIPVMPVAAV
jgi:hypothetical protein